MLNVGESVVTIAEKGPEPAVSPTIREWKWVLLLIGALFALDILTYNLYPAVWCDEVLFSEPAINYVQHGSFTTTVWEFQPGNTFPVVNCPLYSLALVPWLSATGTSLLAIRSFNYSLMALATYLLWLVSSRFGLVKTSRVRIFMVGLFHFGYGISFAFRCSRPDVLGLICLFTLLLSLGIRRNSMRYCFLLVVAAATVWIGLQVALLAFLACAVARLLFRLPRIWDLGMIAAGMAAGMCSLFIFLKIKGVLPYFLPIVVGMLGKHYAHHGHTTFGSGLLKWLRVTLMCYLEDSTTVPLVLGAVTTLIIAGKQFRPAAVSLMRYCLLLIVAVPALFNLVGHFAFYYSYMLFAPAMIAIFAAFSELSVHPALNFRPWLRRSIVLVMIASTVVGLPLRLAITMFTSTLVVRSKIQRVTDSCIVRGDVVFSDYGHFFEVKNAAAVVYAPYYSSALVTTPIEGHDFTTAEKRSITVLVIRPEQAGYLTNFFGGQWTPLTQPFGDVQDFHVLQQLPLIGSRLAHYAAQPQTERYQVQIFRRLPFDR